ncbi:MAG: flagellar basal body-associated FliL family protein [Allosphingosinicella sp.]
MSDAPTPPKKKSRLKKLLLLVVGLAVLGGGGAGAYVYAMGGSLTGTHAGEEEVDEDQPQLVPREGVSDYAAAAGRRQARRGRIDPRLFQATYYPMEANFTSNLQSGQAFVQIGIGVSTYYDERVIENVQRHEMAIRSAILMAISEQDPVTVTTLQGKQALKITLRNAINEVLTNREGFGGIEEVYFTSFVTQ